MNISVGLATKLGVIGTAILALASALTPLLDGAGAGTSKFFAALATFIATATVIGRMLQAAALYRDAPSPHYNYPVSSDE